MLLSPYKQLLQLKPKPWFGKREPYSTLIAGWKNELIAKRKWVASKGSAASEDIERFNQALRSDTFENFWAKYFSWFLRLFNIGDFAVKEEYLLRVKILSSEKSKAGETYMAGVSSIKRFFWRHSKNFSNDLSYALGIADIKLDESVTRKKILEVLDEKLEIVKGLPNSVNEYLRLVERLQFVMSWLAISPDKFGIPKKFKMNESAKKNGETLISRLTAPPFVNPVINGSISAADEKALIPIIELPNFIAGSPLIITEEQLKALARLCGYLKKLGEDCSHWTAGQVADLTKKYLAKLATLHPDKYTYSPANAKATEIFKDINAIIKLLREKNSSTEKSIFTQLAELTDEQRQCLIFRGGEFDNYQSGLTAFFAQCESEASETQLILLGEYKSHGEIVSMVKRNSDELRALQVGVNATRVEVADMQSEVADMQSALTEMQQQIAFLMQKAFEKKPATSAANAMATPGIGAFSSPRDYNSGNGTDTILSVSLSTAPTPNQ